MRWGLVATIVCLLAIMGLEATRYAMLGEILTPDLVLQDRAILRHDRLLDNSRAVFLLSVAVFVATSVTFITWFQRSYRNLLGLGRLGLNHGWGWAIGGWLVPFLNLVRPKQIMDEIWVFSTVAAAGDRRTIAQVPARVHYWWAAFLVGGFADRISGFLVRGIPATLEEYVSSHRASVAVGMVGTVLGIVAGILLLRIVRDVTGLQQQAAAAAEPVTS